MSAVGECGRVYPTRPGERVIRCDLLKGHTGDHEETETGVHWAEPQAPEGSREWIALQFSDRHPATVHLLRLFAWSHLPARLGLISRSCGLLAMEMAGALQDGPELSAGLRHHLEAKDCFVRQALEG
jgi:hypothetical protein